MKVVFITSLTPSGHYSQYITNGLSKQKNIDLIVYAGLHERGKVKPGQYGTVKYVWNKAPSYIREILDELRKDRPDIVHVQQEFNMYGGTLTAALFPLLLLFLRINNVKTVITIHAAVAKKRMDEEFVTMFHKNATLMRPVFLKAFFQYVYKASSMLAHKTFIHTKLKRTILTRDYGVSEHNLTLVPIVIPEKLIKNTDKQRYFFYFGYMVRRKGLEFALEGFKDFIAAHPRSPFKLVMAGGVIKGQEKALDEIKDFITRNNLQHKVEMKGFIEEKDQDKLYNRAYAVIIPARITMGSSGPLFHAMSYGKCCICTREGYFIEDIQNGKSGILTANNKWKEAFEYAVDHPAIVKQIEKNVIARAARQSPVNVGKMYLEHYQSLLS